MKQIFTNWLRAFTLAVSFLFALSISAVEVEINGINYQLLTKIKEATVIKKSGGYLGRIVIPENVEYDGEVYSVTSIGSSAFKNGFNLTSIVIPNSVTSICEDAFYRCDLLTSVTIPNSVTSIGDYAFVYCHKLESVTIGNSVETIGRGAFLYCYRLKSVTIPNSVESIGPSAFDDCTDLTYVELNCKSVGQWFQGNSSIKTLHIGNSVESIGFSAFDGCIGLTSVTIGNSVESIGHYAFLGCSGLTSVTIGNSVKSIGIHTFGDCTELTDVYCFAENVPSTESDAFANSYVEYATLHVPAGTIEDYKTTAPWSSFGTIVALTDEEITGVEEIEAEDANSNDAPVYNINGMKMQDTDNLPKGIYIKGGKKYIVK